MDFIFKPISNQRQIGPKRSLSDIRWIVIHYTGNYSPSADAMAHFRYLQGATRYGSAHYYVDDKQIIQTIGDSYIAWSVGDNQGYGKYLNGCTNANSISIEMCVNKNADPDLVYKNTLELTKNLMKKFSIPAERVCRHYDVSRKDCPHNLRANNWEKWWQFKAEIVKPIEWKMDLSKSSTFGNTKIKEKVVNAMQDEFKRAIEIGITDGSRPKDPATREEVACMVLRGLRLAKGEVLPNIGKEPT